MAKSPEKFADLFSKALDRIKKRNRTKESVKAEIAHEIGRSVHLVEHWLRGKDCPSDISQMEAATRILIRERGLNTREEIGLFLEYAGHPSPAAWESRIARVDCPPEEFGIFIGREEKVEQVVQALQPKRVVVLHGPAGVGKTALVRAVIQYLAPNDTPPTQFVDGILYYDFYENSAEDAFRYIASFYGVAMPENRSAHGAASLALYNKHALIVLDSAEAADNLRKVWLIRQQCGMLIVSQEEPLDLSSEPTIDLDILSPEVAVRVLQAWSRDKKEQNGFQVWSTDGDGDEQTALDICEELGRLPLALRLAGRYMLQGKVKPAKFLSWWQELRLAVLPKGGDRHDSIQLLMGKCLELVQRRSKETLKVMAVAGLLSYEPFGSEVIAAALMISPSVVEKLLQDLWKFSLLRRITAERWQLVHRLAHTYAHTIPTPNETIERLVEYYTACAKEDTSFRIEKACNLAHSLAVVAECIQRKRWDRVLSLSSALAPFLEWSEHMTVFTARVTAFSGRAAEARMMQKWQDEVDELLALFNLYYDERYHIEEGWTKAASYLLEVVTILVQHEEEVHKLGECYFILGWIYNSRGPKEQAIEFYSKARVIFRQCGDTMALVDTCLELRSLYDRIGDEEKDLELELEMAEQLDDYYERVENYYRLSGFEFFNGSTMQTIKLLRRALAILQKRGEIPLQAEVLAKLGEAYHANAIKLARSRQANQSAAQLELAREAYQLAIELNPDNVFLYNNLADVYKEDLNRLDRAVSYYLERIRRRPEDAVNAYVSLGAIAFYQGDEAEAQLRYAAALSVWETAWNRQVQSVQGLLIMKSFALHGLGREEEARASLQEAEEANPRSLEIILAERPATDHYFSWELPLLTRIHQKNRRGPETSAIALRVRKDMY